MNLSNRQSSKPFLSIRSVVAKAYCKFHRCSKSMRIGIPEALWTLHFRPKSGCSQPWLPESWNTAGDANPQHGLSYLNAGATT